MLAAISMADVGVKVLGAGVLAAFVTTIAYIHDPKLKMLVFSMPIPFSCAYLVTGSPIDTTNMVGIVLVTLYHWVVYGMVMRLKLPLAVGIATGVLGYIGFAWLCKGSAQMIPLTVASVIVLLMWGASMVFYRGVQEEGHRSRSPWYVKMPLVFVIALCIYSITGLLAGAVTTFPYAGVFTSYEMRKSLRTLAGQYMVNNLSFILMFVAIAAAEHQHWSRPISLLTGWVAMIVTIWIIYGLGWGAPKKLTVPKPQGA